MTPQPEPSRVTLQELLGEGRFGRVHAATIGQVGQERRVAVKVLRREHAQDEDAIDRLVHEGRILASLDHPGIVSFEGRVQVEGRPGVVMELVDGCSLEDWLEASGALSAKAAVEVVHQVADALDAAWTGAGPDGEALRLAHRDVKPANLLVTTAGEVRLVDFGLARSGTLHRQHQTEAGGKVGTMDFWAPECVTGAAEASHALDIYALGVTWLVARTGHSPWQVRSLTERVGLATSQEDHRAAVRRAVVEAQLTGPAQGLVEQMLAFKAELRPSAREVRQRCEAIGLLCAGESLAERASEHPPRRPSALAATPTSLVGRVITVHERPQQGPQQTDRAVLPVPPPPPLTSPTPPKPPRAEPPRPEPPPREPPPREPPPRQAPQAGPGRRRTGLLGLGCGGALALGLVLLGIGGTVGVLAWSTTLDPRPGTDLARTPASSAAPDVESVAPVEPVEPADCPPLHSAGVRAAAQRAQLDAPALRCLRAAAADTTRPADQREQAFDLLWFQARASCEQGGGCSDWAGIFEHWTTPAVPARRAEELAVGLAEHGGPQVQGAATRWARYSLEHGAFPGSRGQQRRRRLQQITGE